MLEMLPILNFIVQVGLLVGLIWYAIETFKIRRASQASAQATVDMAKTAQENLRLLKESFEERIGQGPQIVKEAIETAKSEIVYWKFEATHIAQPPHGNPDPSRLCRSGLLDALSHARLVSSECASLLILANTAMCNASSELEKAYATARKQTFGVNPGKASSYLEQADGLLNSALKILDK